MRWLKRNLWTIGIVIADILILLLMTWLPLSAASAHEGTPRVATPRMVTVQATPTEDATVTALNKVQLAQQVAGQQHTWDNWLWSNVATILSSFLSTLVIVIGALFGLWRWRIDRRDAQDKELKDRQNERDKRAEERFLAAVTGLGDEKEGTRIGAAILLRTFLHPGYEQFYTQIFDLAVAHLRLPRNAHPPENPNIPLPLTPLSQALMVLFKEAFPLARGQNVVRTQLFVSHPFARGQNEGRSSLYLDSTDIQIDNAYLLEADLKGVWMPRASLRKAVLSGADLAGANLSGANLSGAFLRMTDLSGADLSKADLSKAKLIDADLSETNLEDVLSLEDTHLARVRGLTKEQLEACRAKGAVIDEVFPLIKNLLTDSSQSTTVPSPSSQSNDAQAPSAPESPPPPDTDGSSAVSSQPASES